MANSSEFHVKLDGIKLPPEAEKQIAAEVQATVFRELAKLDLPEQGFALRIPGREWRGIWAYLPKAADGGVPTFAVTK